MNHAIILAAGKGERIDHEKDKMLILASGKPLIYYSIMAFNDHPEISTITVVVNKANEKEIKALVKISPFKKVTKIIIGGNSRQESLKKGFSTFAKTAKDSDIILVHNGANPLVSSEEISEVISKTKKHGACITGHFVSSTIKEVNGIHVIKTHDRKKLFAAETPQAGTYKIFKIALKNAEKKKLKVTDEAMLFEAIGQKVAYVEAHKDNFKITTNSDYEKFKVNLGDTVKDFRVGIGLDSHMFEEKKKGLVLVGVSLKNELKLEANSDGDVVLHALFNALSQAVGEMSLGFYADGACEKGVTDSKKYLEIILKKIKNKKFEIHSVGIMIEAAKPQIDPLVHAMKNSLSKLLGLEKSRIGITATTGEHCTVFGEGLGIQCFAIVSLKERR